MDLYLLTLLVFNVTVTHEMYMYCHSLSRHDVLPFSSQSLSHVKGRRMTCVSRSMLDRADVSRRAALLGIAAAAAMSPSIVRATGALSGFHNVRDYGAKGDGRAVDRSEEHTSELQSLMRTSYAVFCLQKKHKHPTTNTYSAHLHPPNH